MATWKRVRAALLLSTLVLLAWAGPGPAAAESTAQRLRAVLDALEAQPVACPTDLARYGVAAEADCYTVTGGFRAVRKAVNRQFDSDWPFRYWTRDQGYRIRMVPGVGDVFNFAFDAEEELLAIAPYRPCAVDPAVHVADEPGFEAPRLVRQVSPDFPEEMRKAHIEGALVARVVIGEDGHVGDICVIRADPAGYGFEEAAAQALRQWVYEPPRVDGKPVRVYSIVWVAWSVGSN